MFPRYIQYLLTDFRQTFVTSASRGIDELIRFWGQKVKVQGHIIAAEAHNTRRYRRVQLFLVPNPEFRTGQLIHGTNYHETGQRAKMLLLGELEYLKIFEH